MSTASLNPTLEQAREQTSERKALRRAASASFMGNFVEWFDYAAYGYLATVIALTFFPQTDKASALLTVHRRSVMIGIGVTCLNAVAFYLLLSYMPTYLSTDMGMSESDSFLASTVSLATYIGLIFLMGKLSDRFGRKTMLLTASVLFLVLTFPLFGMLEHQPLLVILMIQIAFGAILAMNDGTLPCFLAEIFPTRVRFSGFAFSFNIANAVFGGTAPFIATWLIQMTGNKMAPAWYLLAAAAVALVAMLASRETAHKALQD